MDGRVAPPLMHTLDHKLSPFALAHRALRRTRPNYGGPVVPGFPAAGIGAYVAARERGATVTAALAAARKV